MTAKEALLNLVTLMRDEYNFPFNLTTEYKSLKQALNELEGLKKFKETFDNYELAKKRDFIAYENWLECEAELNRFPTVDEVCKTLSDFTKRQVTYNNAKKDFIDEYENSVEQFLFDAYHLKKIPPHLITMIGRFYEGVEVKE